MEKSEQSNSKNDSRVKKRRQLLKSIVAGGGASVLAAGLPDKWSKPLVDSVVLPAHAQTSQSDITITFLTYNFESPTDSCGGANDPCALNAPRTWVNFDYSFSSASGIAVFDYQTVFTNGTGAFTPDDSFGDTTGDNFNGTYRIDGSICWGTATEVEFYAILTNNNGQTLSQLVTTVTFAGSCP